MARVRRARSEWEGLVRQFDRSGTTYSVFARKHGLVEATLRWWCSQLRESVGFVEVEVAEPGTSGAADFVVVVRSGHHVVVPAGFDAAELRRLVAALC